MNRTNIRVNYDLIADLYDEPGRDYAVDLNLIRFLKQRKVIDMSQIRILDMGCGTGKQLTADHKCFPEIRMIGLDLFQSMLDIANKRCPDICWVQGDSTNTSFEDNEFDYITNQFSYHHIEDKRKLFIETFRILHPGGRLVITNLDPWSMQNWILYKFFPKAKNRDYADFLPVDKMVDLLKEIGFCNVGFDRQILPQKEDVTEFLVYASQRYRTSQLISLADDDYELGLKRIRTRIKRTQMIEKMDSEICLVCISGDKLS